MSGRIVFATVSDSRTVSEIFDTLPNEMPVHCLDTWSIKSKSGQVFNGGLIFCYESDLNKIEIAFERVKDCREWKPRDNSDIGCVYVQWDDEADEKRHLVNQEIVHSIITDFSNILLGEEQPTFNDRDNHAFISFKKGRGYVPALIGALNIHPMLQKCHCRFANKRVRHNGPNVERLSTEEIISHGNFKAQPKKLKHNHKED